MPAYNFLNLFKTYDGRKAMSDLLSFVENKGERNKAYAAFLYLMMNSVGAEGGAMWLYDSFGGSRLNCIVKRGTINTPVHSLLLGEDLPGQAVEFGKSRLSDNGKRLCVPIRTENAVFGVIELVQLDSQIFNKRDEDMANAICTMLSETIVSHSNTLILGYYSLKQSDQLSYCYNSFDMIERLADIIETRKIDGRKNNRKMRALMKLLLSEVNRNEPSYELSEDRIEIISAASAMHDLGKVLIPDAILYKPGRLDVDEFEIVKKHTVYGKEIMESLSGTASSEFLRYAEEICLMHHERYDGRGYPNRIKGEEIPIWAQCAGVIDAYLGLTSMRCYKGAYTHQDAVEMILNKECGEFSPVVFNSFKAIADNIKKVCNIMESQVLHESD